MLCVQGVSKAPAAPRCSLLHPQHMPSAGMWIGVQGSSHPGQLTVGYRVAPIMHPYSCTSWGLWRVSGAHPSSRGVPWWELSGPCPVTLPQPRLGMGGMLSPGSSGAVEEEVAGRGGEGRQGAPALQGTF